MFNRGTEPLPENLKTLSQNVIQNNADVGFAVDPDADRLAVVDENGTPLGEEYSLVLARTSEYSSPRGVPFSSTTASLSASGSTANPTSALFWITFWDKVLRFSGKGSVPLLNIPLGSQSNLITSQPSLVAR